MEGEGGGEGERERHSAPTFTRAPSRRQDHFSDTPSILFSRLLSSSRFGTFPAVVVGVFHLPPSSLLSLFRLLIVSFQLRAPFIPHYVLGTSFCRLEAQYPRVGSFPCLSVPSVSFSSPSFRESQSQLSLLC